MPENGNKQIQTLKLCRFFTITIQVCRSEDSLLRDLSSFATSFEINWKLNESRKEWRRRRRKTTMQCDENNTRYMTLICSKLIYSFLKWMRAQAIGRILTNKNATRYERTKIGEKKYKFCFHVASVNLKI